MSTAARYFGSWSSAEDVREAFTEGYGDGRRYPEGMATDAEILFATYGGAAYEGWAMVIFERDGTLYEVIGSHCSCYGLEGQWTPEATTWAALAMRPAAQTDGPVESWDRERYNDDYSPEGLAAFRGLVAAHA